MADGYEPTSAVSQGAAAGAAMFGTPQPSQALGYAQLQQQNKIANQNMAADERRAQEGQQQFQQGVGLQREQMAATSNESSQRRDHEVKMEQQRQQFEQRLQQQAFDRSQSLKVAELEFAKANAEERERLAPLLIQKRKEAANLNAKIAANKVLGTQGRERLGQFIDQATQMKDAMEKSRAKEGEIGSRASTAALNRMYEDIINSGKDGYKTYNDMIGDQGYGLAKLGGEAPGFDLIKIRPDIVDELSRETPQNRLEIMGRSIGQMISNTTGGFIDTGSDASAVASIDDDKIESKSSELISRHIARSISEQTGDKIPPDQIREVLDAMFKGGDNVGDQAVMLGKLQNIGVSPEVVKSALVHVAHTLDGTDEGPFSRLSIKKQMEGVAPGSAQEMALQATLKLVDRMQVKARVAAGQLPEADVDGLSDLISYIQQGVQGGGAIKRSELERRVPTFMGGRQDEDLLQRIRSDTLLGDLENLGADPFGALNREENLLRRQSGDVGAEETGIQQELDLLEGGGSRALGGLIGRTKGIK